MSFSLEWSRANGQWSGQRLVAGNIDRSIKRRMDQLVSSILSVHADGAFLVLGSVSDGDRRRAVVDPVEDEDATGVRAFVLRELVGRSAHQVVPDRRHLGASEHTQVLVDLEERALLSQPA